MWNILQGIVVTYALPTALHGPILYLKYTKLYGWFNLVEAENDLLLIHVLLPLNKKVICH